MIFVSYEIQLLQQDIDLRQSVWDQKRTKKHNLVLYILDWQIVNSPKCYCDNDNKVLTKYVHVMPGLVVFLFNIIFFYSNFYYGIFNCSSIKSYQS